MSETWLHGIRRWGEGACPILESYENSHGSAPVVWNFMTQRFADAESYYHIPDEVLWKLAYRKDIPEHYRRVMLMTYDRAVILQADIEQAISDLHRFLDDFVFPSNRVNHWGQIAEDLKTYSSTKKYIGFGFCMTTIGDTFFQGEEYKKRHFYKHHKIRWKEEGFFSVYAK